MFMASRPYLVNSPIVRGPARDRGSVKVPAGCDEQTRIGAPAIGAARKAVQDGERSRRGDAEEGAKVEVTTVKSHPIEIAVSAHAKPTGRVTAIGRTTREGM